MDSFLVFLLISSLGYGGLKLKQRHDQMKNFMKMDALEETLEEEYDKKCMFIFSKCREKSISTFDTEENIEILRMIASSYEITDIEEAKNCYYYGKTLVEDVEIEKKHKLISELREKDLNEFKENELRTHIKGKEKYLPIMEKAYRQALDNIKSTSDALYYEPIETVEQNYSDDEYYEEMYDVPPTGFSKEDSKIIEESYSTVAAYKHAIRHKKESVEDFNKKVVDESNIAEKFKVLNFSNVKCLVLKSKNIRVSGYVNITEELKLLGSDALLDGSLKITVLDENDKELGYGYYSTGIYKDGFLIDSGFTKKEKRFSCICIIKEYEKITDDTILKCKIEPVNMWLIEK